MPTLLVIEASTAAGSVALLRNGAVVDAREIAMGASRDDALLPAIVSVLDNARARTSDLNGIVCGSGPGSFTSLRIAAALCKGLATPHATALYAVPSLLLAGAALNQTPGEYLVHSDALRGERFAAHIEIGIDGGARLRGAIQRVPFNDLQALAESHNCTAVAVGENSITADTTASVIARASAFAHVAAPLSAFGPVSLAEWEPAYGRLAEAQVKWEADHGRPLPLA